MYSDPPLLLPCIAFLVPRTWELRPFVTTLSSCFRSQLGHSQMYHSLARDSTDLGGDGYEYDSRLAAVGLATHPALAQPSPFWTSLIVVRFLPVILAASWVSMLLNVTRSIADS